jgi:Mg/Co/Ni transporter MgtE
VTLQESLLRRFAGGHPTEAAAILGEQSADGVAAVLDRLSEETAAIMLGRTASPVAAGALSRLDPASAGALLGRMPLERAAALLRHLELESCQALLATLPKPERLRSLIMYPRGTAGALMDPSLLALPAALDLGEARRRLGEFSAYLALDLYVVDTDHRLVGVTDLREVLDSSRRGTLAALSRAVEPLREHADLAFVGAHPGWLDHDTLPVVDDRGTYLGAVRAKTLRRAAHEAVTRRSRAGADAVLALGELFWLGVSGLFSSLARPQPEKAE